MRANHEKTLEGSLRRWASRQDSFGSIKTGTALKRDVSLRRM